MRRRTIVLLIGAMAVSGLAVPVLLYRIYLGGAPTVSPEEACAAIRDSGGRAVLVDIRKARDFEEMHAAGAISLPYAKIGGMRSARDLPGSLAGRRLYLLCYAGISGARAAAALKKMGVDAVNVRDGMQGWVANGRQPCVKSVRAVRRQGGESGWPSRISPYHEQLAIFVSGFIVKPLYMIMAFALIFLLARIRGPDSIALAIGMAFFLLGEDACAVEYLFNRFGGHLLEFLHSFGMLAGFGFMAWGFMEMADRRFMHYSDPGKRCAALEWCGECIKYKQVPCRLRSLFHFVIPAVLVLAFIPLTGKPVAVSYNTEIFGVPFSYVHPVVYQLFEIRWCPVTAIMLLILAEISLLLSAKHSIALPKIFFSAALGALGFGMARFVLVQAFRDNLVWFYFWEELTEFLFVFGIAVLLYVYRKSFFRGRDGKQGYNKDMTVEKTASPGRQ